VAATKVPEITAWFWIAKVASTGMGVRFGGSHPSIPGILAGSDQKGVSSPYS
jgi:hypothetical protein